MRRRQHRKMRYRSWMPLALMGVYLAVVAFIVCVTPFDEMSGTVTDKWEDGGDYVLELDNSFTENVDAFEYNNVRIGGVYEWEVMQDVPALLVSLIPVVVVTFWFMFMVRSED